MWPECVWMYMYTCSSIWSTAVWLQSNHWKHPLKSGIKAGLGEEHYYLHTHTQDAARTFDSWVKGRCFFLLCPSKQQTCTCSAFSLIYLFFKGHINREEEKETEKKGWKTGTPKCRLSVLLELLKASGRLSRIKLPALIWLYLLCFLTTTTNPPDLLYTYILSKNESALHTQIIKVLNFMNIKKNHMFAMLACKC